MKTLSVVLALLCGVASAECRQDRRDRRLNRLRDDCGSTGIPDDPGQFVFAPTNGAGMTAACACTAVTGSRGEAATFSRASDATCTKGNETSLIANGDLVTCSSGQPRVMPGGDGTGILGVSLWASRTNSTLRSQEFENAAWSIAGSSAAAPTVTANYATAPDGTSTADRVQIAATSSAGGGFSLLFQASACPAATHSYSVYAKGVSGSGSFRLCNDAAVVSESVCTNACNFVSTSWTRCVVNGNSNTAQTRLLFGNVSDNGGNSRNAADVLLWGAQCEAGDSASPVIATAGTSATRVDELLTFPWAQADDTSGSMAATLVTPYPSMGNLGEHTLLSEQVAGSYNRLLLVNTSSNLLIGHGINATYLTGAIPADTERRAVYWWTPGTSGILWNGVPTGGTTFPSGDVSTIAIGYYNAGSSLTNGVIKNVCADSSSTVCQ